MTNSLICHLYRVVVAEATRCGDGERGASGERVTFCCRREGRRQDTEKGGKTQMERERVKRCRWEPEMIRAPPPPLSLSNRKRLCNTGSLLTGMSKHPQIAIEEREDRLADTHQQSSHVASLQIHATLQRCKCEYTEVKIHTHTHSLEQQKLSHNNSPLITAKPASLTLLPPHTLLPLLLLHY